MDKDILNQYIDACELVKETEEQIRALKMRRKTVVQCVVKGSMPEFPYVAQNFRVSGVPYSVVEDPGQLEREELLLEERKARAQEIKRQVEAWMNTIPVRMQRIIRMKIFDGMTWEQVAVRIGRRATGNSLKKEFERFMKAS